MDSFSRKYNIVDNEFWRFFYLQLAELLIRSNGIDDDELDYYIKACSLSFDEERNMKIESIALSRRSTLAWCSSDIEDFETNPRFKIMWILRQSMEDNRQMETDGVDGYTRSQIQTLESAIGEIGPNELDSFIEGCFDIYAKCQGEKKTHHKDFYWRIR